MFSGRAALLCTLLAACAGPRTDWHREELVVASSFDRPSEAELGPDGLPVGREVDLIRAIAERTDRVLVWRREAAESALGLLESGRAHLACYDLATLAAWGDRVDRLAPPYDTLGIALSPYGSELAALVEDALRDLEPR